MYLRIVLAASLFAALGLVIAEGMARAAPQHNHGLTINATPNPIVTGDPVLIYGQLNRPHPGSQKIVLYHRVNPSATFAKIQTTVTDASGFYEFTRAVAKVPTNRSWFVRALGAGNVHSRTVHERVAAALTLTVSTAIGDMRHPLTFAGQIAPAGVHVGETVFLQELKGDTGDAWATIGQGAIDASSSYSITHAFLQPGSRDLRVAFGGDSRNAKAYSDPVTVTIQQTQNPAFTINTSSPTIVVGSTPTISGVLYAPGSTSVPSPTKSVTLWGHEAGGTYAPISSTVTGADGSYSFTPLSAHNEVYQARTTVGARLTAQLFEAVGDLVTVGASSTSSAVGQTVTLTGTITPDKAGHVIYLERLTTHSGYQNESASVVGAGSTYAFKLTLGTSGTKTFRVRIAGGESNVGGVSPAIAIAVAQPSVTSLPAAVLRSPPWSQPRW